MKYIYSAQDRSSGPDATKVDRGLTFRELYHMTDYSDGDLEQILDMEPDDEVILDGWIWIKRVA